MHQFKARRSKPRVRHFIALDTETDSYGNFICGALWGDYVTPDGKPHDYRFYTEDADELVEALQALVPLRARYTLIGHNVDYDLVYLGEYIDTSTKLYAGSRFITAKTKDGIQILDTANFVDGSLESWMERLGIGKKIEGYLDSPDLKRQQVMEDARATCLLAEWIQKFFLRHKVSLRYTRFSTALALFQHKFFEGEWKRTQDWLNRFEREAYYGGRVEVFKRGRIEVHSYDINGMYVSIMAKQKIPNPSKTCYLTDPGEIEELFHNGAFMILRVDVEVPPMKVGVLPYRQGEDAKLIFPTGRWTGTYTNIELQAALQYGARILRYRRAVCYPEAKPYFREYARWTQNGRRNAQARGDAAMDSLYKFLGNGLYGKFAQRNGGGVKYIRLKDYAGDVEGKQIIWNDNGGWVVERDGEARDAYHAFPVISAFISSYARVQLLHALKANEKNVVYCDTDSIKVNGEVTGIDIGDQPGQWGYEYTQVQEFYRPKTYAEKRKGVPKRAKLVAMSIDRDAEVWRYETPVKFRSSVRRNISQNLWEDTLKIVCLDDDKRDWVDGLSRPHAVEDIEKTVENNIDEVVNQYLE